MTAALPCAIYTRKSSEEGLDQGFNSLDAQREACEAYVLSQKSLGWRAVATSYDDGGFSGGNIERPALQRLMADIRARRIRVVVVYKVDRLTRSLGDFSKLIELFDSLEVSFVSVTQQFNTTTSMGRLTLNVLLSFAQFEREVTGERIRDKIAASKRKGMWMGGNPPIGYIAHERTLTVDEPQAQRVRAIFELYLSLGSITALKNEIDRRAWLTPIRSTGSNREMGGRQFSGGHLRNILQNRIYRGRIIHKGVEHEGLHPAIIDEPLWNAVQEKLQGLLTDHHTRKGALYPSLLAGLLYDAEGRRFDRAQTFNHSRSYRYYLCPTSGQGSSASVSPMHIPSEVLESEVIAALMKWLEAWPLPTESSGSIDLVPDPSLQAQARGFAKRLRDGADSDRIEVLKTVLVRVNVHSDHLELMIRDIGPSMQAQWNTGTDVGRATPLQVPFDLQRFQKAMRLVVPKEGNTKSTKVEPVIGSLLVKAHDWSARLRSGRYDGVQAIASEEEVSSSYVTRVIYLAFLAPDLALRIFLGDHPEALTTRKLLSMLPLPERWSEQRKLLGMET